MCKYNQNTWTRITDKWTKIDFFIYSKLMKGKALRKHSLHEKTTASVLLKMFISGNECCHTTDAPSA